MRFLRLPIKDPRTVARDIPGIIDLLFPQLIPAIVANLNRQLEPIPGISPISYELIKNTTNPAMLFELAYARAEQIILNPNNTDWDSCIQTAFSRQLKYFDAKLPNSINESDYLVAGQTAANIIKSIDYLKNKFSSSDLIISPRIHGYHWINNGEGDFAIDNNIIEIKCTNSYFSSSDYRQVLMYWLLSYAASIENEQKEWETFTLLNPRLNHHITLNTSELVNVLGAGRSKIEILQLFNSLISDYELQIFTNY